MGIKEYDESSLAAATEASQMTPAINDSQPAINATNVESTVTSEWTTHPPASSTTIPEIKTTDVVEKLLQSADVNATEFETVNATQREIIATKESEDYLKPNLTIYWIDATYKAYDKNLNVTTMEECEPWVDYWASNNVSALNDGHGAQSNGSAFESETTVRLVERELVDDEERLSQLGLSAKLLDEYKAVGLFYKEICGNHHREFWYTTTDDAKKIGINEKSLICDPFKISELTYTEELNPNEERLKQLARQLNELVNNVTNGTGYFGNFTINNEPSLASTSSPIDYFEMMVSGDVTATSTEPSEWTIDAFPSGGAGDEEQKGNGHTIVVRVKRKITAKTIADDDDFWLEDILFETSKAHQATVRVVAEWRNTSKEEKDEPQPSAVMIDATDESSPTMTISSLDVAKALQLNIPEHFFKRYEKIGFFLPGICADFVPTAVDEFDASAFEGVEIEGPIGVNITALEIAGVNLTELAEKLRNDTEVDEILARTNVSTRTLGGSFILPVLHKNKYDQFSAPIVFQGSAVVVRFGIYIESMSNFQTSTMDYDMDIYLMMAWRDARLVNPYQKPILVKEEEILEKIWRPDPFFANAKEAEFHEVTFLNFLMRIFPDGLVLYETRIKLKPACNLVLCKYPHDKQTCELRIKSFAYPLETVRFEWFTRKHDAIDKNPDVKLPELYIDRYEPTVCDRTRKSGDFSCLRAVFRLKRDVGFHIAQTYIPTSLALMFSWVGVWLPEEFMEGRIGVAITVLLTLSTESAGAREHLPSVSYLKAIDLWFGFITGFVFFTLLQTLFVIGFDKRARQLRKWATKKKVDATEEAKESVMNKANLYHKTGRYLDNFCRVFYPLIFVMFLIMYYFVFTEGRQDDCISAR
uniref:MACPF domain-containing protein n=1 Tax=Toxocara canis TaxID=6265 RepID=A0A183UU37_TOXCA